MMTPDERKAAREFSDMWKDKMGRGSVHDLLAKALDALDSADDAIKRFKEIDDLLTSIAVTMSGKCRTGYDVISDHGILKNVKAFVKRALGAEAREASAPATATDAADKPVEDAEVARRIDLLRALAGRDKNSFPDEQEYWPDEHIAACHMEMRLAATLIERLHRQLAAMERETAEKCVGIANSFTLLVRDHPIAAEIRHAFNLDKEPDNG